MSPTTIGKSGRPVLRPSQIAAQALRVPPNGTIHIVSDSTLKVYPHHTLPGGIRAKAVTVSHKVRNDNYGITVTECIESGARIQDMIRHLRDMSDEKVGAFDCTIVVCMFNAKPSQQQLGYDEMSGMSSFVIELCNQLGRHKCAALIMGGSASLWRFSEEWDRMVQKNVAISRVQGIMTIDGTRYFEEMQQVPNGWHFAKTENNLDKMRDMI